MVSDFSKDFTSYRQHFSASTSAADDRLEADLAHLFLQQREINQQKYSGLPVPNGNAAVNEFNSKHIIGSFSEKKVGMASESAIDNVLMRELQSLDDMGSGLADPAAQIVTLRKLKEQQ